MTDQRADQPGGGPSPTNLADPAAKTQPAEGGRDEVEESFDPESSGQTPTAGWSEDEDSSSEASRP